MYSKLTDAKKSEEAYRQIKQGFEGAVQDEREAAAIYNRIIDIALKGGCKEFVNEVRSIKEQEEWHEVTFRRLVAEAEKKGMDLKREIQRRPADEQRKAELAQKDRLNSARITEIRRRGSGY